MAVLVLYGDVRPHVLLDGGTLTENATAGVTFIAQEAFYWRTLGTRVPRGAYWRGSRTR